eukprot:scaffold15798_cov40-Cyclotella_meneghiniana.AAC.5
MHCVPVPPCWFSRSCSLQYSLQSAVDVSSQQAQRGPISARGQPQASVCTLAKRASPTVSLLT